MVPIARCNGAAHCEPSVANTAFRACGYIVRGAARQNGRGATVTSLLLSATTVSVRQQALHSQKY